MIICTGCSHEGMAKSISIKEAVKVRAKDSGVWADAPIGYRLLRHVCLAHELSKGLRMSDIRCLANMDLVSCKETGPMGWSKRDFASSCPVPIKVIFDGLMVVLIGNKQRPRIDSESSTPSGSTISSPSICIPPQIPVIRPFLACSITADSSPSFRIHRRSSAVCLLPGRITTSAPCKCSGYPTDADTFAPSREPEILNCANSRVNC